MLKTGPDTAHEITHPHPVAAFCLDNQPFGFRTEDLERFADLLDGFNLEGLVPREVDGQDMLVPPEYDMEEWEHSLSARLSALLRPREETRP